MDLFFLFGFVIAIQFLPNVFQVIKQTKNSSRSFFFRPRARFKPHIQIFLVDSEHRKPVKKSWMTWKRGWNAEEESLCYSELQNTANREKRVNKKSDRQRASFSFGLSKQQQRKEERKAKLDLCKQSHSVVGKPEANTIPLDFIRWNGYFAFSNFLHSPSLFRRPISFHVPKLHP